MKNAWIIAGLVACFPMTAVAQAVPLYIETNGELDFTDDYLGDAQLAELLGGADAVDTFGPPKFVVRNERKGTIRPVWANVVEYELVQGGDGVVEDRHDDLVFDESEAHDVHEDLVFTKNEGLSVSNDTSGPQTDILQPANGLWNIALSRSDAVGCPPGIAELALAQLAKTGSREIVFSEPRWVPADLNPDYRSYSWTPVGTNGFKSEPYTTRPQVAGSGVSLVVTIALNAKSDRQIDVRAQVQMDLAPALAVIAGGSTTCLATINGSYTKN